MQNQSLFDKLIFWFKNNKFFSIIIFLAILIIAISNVFNSITSIFEKGNKYLYHAADSIPDTINANTGFARVIFKFGSKGIGPGFFRNAHCIAVDGKQRIYVGEYRNGGRIQVFDSAGRFISQWNAEDTTSILFGIANDNHGNLYAADGDIYRYNAETGKLSGRIKCKGFSGFMDVKIKLDGEIVASDDEDIFIYDSNEKMIHIIHQAVQSHSYDGESNNIQEEDCDHIAVDGLGNIYVMEDDGHTVYKFSSEGKFLNRFGSYGEEPGQFRLAWAIAVDGKGRVYVSDQNQGILVFDSEGRYISKFNIDNENGLAAGMVFNDRNELFVAADDRVVKYILNDNL